MNDHEASSKPACILIVEDDMMLAMLLEDQLADLGHRTIKAARVATAVRMIAGSAAIDAAILDVNVAGDLVYPVAEALRARGIPFAFATGYGNAGLKAEFRDSPTLSKPYAAGELKRILTQILSPARPGA